MVLPLVDWNLVLLSVPIEQGANDWMSFHVLATKLYHSHRSMLLVSRKKVCESIGISSITLFDISGNNHFAAFTDSGESTDHAIFCGILCFIENNHTVFESASYWLGKPEVVIAVF
jgi:hypothetical protein